MPITSGMLCYVMLLPHQSLSLFLLVFLTRPICVVELVGGTQDVETDTDLDFDI